MRTVVINTGTEILLGDVLNTHLTFIAQEIFPLGLRVDEQRTVPDGDAIRAALQDVLSSAELIFVTGGLGPTTDDITRDLVAELLSLPLEEDAEVREAIRARLACRKIPMPDRIWRQAQVPRGGKVLPNHHGTAPGIYFSRNVNPAVASAHLFLLPGPPRELRPMFDGSVRPILQKIMPAASGREMRRYRMANVGESIVEHAIGEQLMAIPDLEVGYCARPGEVDLRLIGSAEALAAADELVQGKLGDKIFTTDDETLAEVLVRELSRRKEILALAESCTGGFLANEITNVPGASAVLWGGGVTYADDAKRVLARVDPHVIEEHGAVSEETARAMADGARTLSDATYAIATTGIAGPDGGSKEKPVGTVFVAIAAAGHATQAQKLFLPTDRVTFKQMVAQNAFDLLRRRLRAV